MTCYVGPSSRRKMMTKPRTLRMSCAMMGFPTCLTPSRARKGDAADAAHIFGIGVFW